MSLTKEDLLQVKAIVTDVVKDVVMDVVTDVVTDAISGLATKAELNTASAGLATKAEVEQIRLGMTKLATKTDLDRFESRFTASIGLVERDAFNRLDAHDVRITRLEQTLPK